MIGISSVSVLEKVRIVTRLGIQFWDYATNTPIVAGLRVTAHSTVTGTAPVEALASPSGVYGFHGLPGLHAVEYPAESDIAPSSPPASSPPSNGVPFIISVDDSRGRYLPMVFALELPLDSTGPFQAPALSSPPASPPGSGSRAYLYSAPTRPAMTGVATIRSDLWDNDRDLPAAYAVLTLAVAGVRATGIADDRGRVLVMLPYPPLERLRLGSPPGANQGKVSDQLWPVVVRVRYEPARLRSPFEGRPGGGPWRAVPGLKSVLEGQREGKLWETVPPPGGPRQQFAALDRELAYGRELILYTNPIDPNRDDGRLLVTAAGP